VRVTVSEVVRAFEVLYDGIHDRAFRKTLPMHTYGERALAPLVRTFLLGWFGRVSPEQRSSLPTCLTGEGSIDFVIGNVAVEFAVRRPAEGRTPLSDVTNSTEIIKLMRHDGPALLVLFDLSPRPLDREALERYRRWRSLGKGNHRKSAFNVAYFHRIKGKPITSGLIRLNVRPPRRG
jgi:hypothetical protein